MDLFGTAGIRGDVTDAVTPELALAVGRAVGLDASDHGVSEVVLGRDGRLTGRGLEAATVAGLVSAGVNVRRTGIVPTPALAFVSVGRRGVMITASHNPPGDNGIKVFADGVEFDHAAERRIEELVGNECEPVAGDAWGRVDSIDVLEAYRSAVVRYAGNIGADLEGLAIAVDCGTGTASLAVPHVLTSLGASVTALNATIDGHFTARSSKPTAESLADLRSFVADGPYDLGFGLDGDADRVVVVDGRGEIVHEDTVVAILAERYVAECDGPEPTVVTTPNASARVDERVEAAGGRTVRVALGALHQGIASERASGSDVAFAAEPWKHVHPRFGGWIDGVTSTAVISRLVADAGGLAALRAPVTERPYRKDEVECPDTRKEATMTNVAAALPGRFPDARVDSEYGVRLDMPDGSWILIRPSGTEPVIRLYAEGEDVDTLLDTARAVVLDAVSERRR